MHYFIQGRENNRVRCMCIVEKCLRGLHKFGGFFSPSFEFLQEQTFFGIKREPMHGGMLWMESRLVLKCRK